MTSPQHYPRCRVIVAQGTSERENQLPVLQADISRHVKRARTVKTLRAPNGTFEIGLTFRPLEGGANAVSGEAIIDQRSLNQILVPDNVVNIAFDGGGTSDATEFETVMLGLITKVYERTTIDDSEQPQVVREIVVTGEDFGKILVNHDLPAHLFTAFLLGDLELAKRVEDGVLLWGTVKEVTEKLFKFVFRETTSDLQKVFGDYIDFVVEEELGKADRGYIFTEGVWGKQGKFWNELRGLADDPWNELYADYDRVTATYVIRLRRRPLDRELWEALLTHEITDGEIKLQEVYLADDERVNLVFVPPSGTIKGNTDFGLDYLIFSARRFDRQDAGEHGARIMRRQSAYYDYPGGGGSSLANTAGEQQRWSNKQGKVFGNLDDRADRLYRWFNINHRLYRGTMVLNGRPEIHIGQRVRNQREPSTWYVETEYPRLTFYVEQVIQDFIETSVSPRYFTHLGLTRGQETDGFIEPWMDGKV